jgi:hypothetical protein
LAWGKVKKVEGSFCLPVIKRAESQVALPTTGGRIDGISLSEKKKLGGKKGMMRFLYLSLSLSLSPLLSPAVRDSW